MIWGRLDFEFWVSDLLFWISDLDFRFWILYSDFGFPILDFWFRILGFMAEYGFWYISTSCCSLFWWTLHFLPFSCRVSSLAWMASCGFARGERMFSCECVIRSEHTIEHWNARRRIRTLGQGAEAQGGNGPVLIVRGQTCSVLDLEIREAPEVIKAYRRINAYEHDRKWFVWGMTAYSALVAGWWVVRLFWLIFIDYAGASGTVIEVEYEVWFG